MLKLAFTFPSGAGGIKPGAAAGSDADASFTWVQGPAGPGELVHLPDISNAVETPLRDWRGNRVTVHCSTCHSLRTPTETIHRAKDLKIFHQGLVFEHGRLECTACHDTASSYDKLRRPDGQEVEFNQVIEQCSLCHGPQARNFRHGAHGGMSGAWDAAVAPRRRKTCVDCHDPHAPHVRQVKPARGPRDRFLRSREDNHD